MIADLDGSGIDELASLGEDVPGSGDRDRHHRNPRPGREPESSRLEGAELSGAAPGALGGDHEGPAVLHGRDRRLETRPGRLGIGTVHGGETGCVKRPAEDGNAKGFLLDQRPVRLRQQVEHLDHVGQGLVVGHVDARPKRLDAPPVHLVHADSADEPQHRHDPASDLVAEAVTAAEHVPERHQHQSGKEQQRQDQRYSDGSRQRAGGAQASAPAGRWHDRLRGRGHQLTFADRLGKPASRRRVSSG